MRITLRRAGLVAAASATIALGAAPFAAAQPSGQTDADATSSAAEAPASGSGELTGSASGLIPGADKECKLPQLGGSIESILPYLGLSIPSSVTGSVTDGLDGIDNPVAAAGFKLSDLGVGSLEGPICTAVLGGEMVDAEETPSTSESTTATTTTEAEDSDEASAGSSIPDTGSLGSGTTVPTTTATN